MNSAHHLGHNLRCFLLGLCYIGTSFIDNFQAEFLKILLILEVLIVVNQLLGSVVPIPCSAFFQPYCLSILFCNKYFFPINVLSSNPERCVSTLRVVVVSI